jgi:hypothetical protein
MDQKPDDPEDEELRRKLLGDQPGPRPHHYAFAHDHLPGVLWHDPRMLLFTLFEASELFLEDQLRIRWQVVGERFDPAERLGDEGLSSSIHTLANGFQAAVITLPPPQASCEAHMVAVAYRPPRRRLLFWKTEPVLRYFTLEHGFDPETNEWLPLLCEWTRHGHLNYGEGPAPEVAAFLEAVRGLLTTNRPVSAAWIRPQP